MPPSDTYIDLFSSTAATVFNELTYLLTYTCLMVSISIVIQYTIRIVKYVKIGKIRTNNTKRRLQAVYFTVLVVTA